MDANLVGKTIQGRYHIINQLGRGGVGITFLAEDKQCFNTQCVVKQLKPRSTNPKTLQVARRLFNREAEILNHLGSCDRIPRLLAYFEDQGDFFLVQELIEGEDLSQEIVDGRPWSEAETITLLRDIMEVLQVVQQHNVIHRDLKPSNLMRRYKDRKIVLIDFGSVKQVSTQVINAQGQVQPTVAVGTRAYMPMEQMMGRPGFYSDIYAVGIIAIQVLTGVPPKELSVDSNGELEWQQRLDPNVQYNPQLLKIIDRMVCYRFQERYPLAEEVLADLDRLNTTPQLNTTNQEVINTTIVDQSGSNNNQPKSVKNHTFTSQFLLNTHHHDSLNQAVDAPPPQKVTSDRSKGKLGRATAIILSLLSGVAVVFGIWQLKTSNSIKLALYEHENFRVSYPENWSQRNRPDIFATGVVFIANRESERDNFSETVSILVENLPPDLSLAQYSKESIAEIKKLSDPDVSAPQKTILDNHEARTVTFRGEQNGVAVRSRQIWSVKNSQAYVITYTAEPKMYNSYLPAVNKIVDSFKMIPSNQK